MINKLKLAFKSRTVWTVIAMFIIGGVNGVHDIIPSAYITLTDGILGLLAIYFRVNPRV